MLASLSPLRLSALGMIILAVAFGLGSFKLGFWEHGIPGSGLLPAIASAALLLVGGLLLVQSLRQPAGAGFRIEPVAALLLLAVYVASLPYAGFVLPNLLLLFVWVRFFQHRSLLAAALVSILVTGCGLLLFNVLLDAPIQAWPNV